MSNTYLYYLITLPLFLTVSTFAQDKNNTQLFESVFGKIVNETKLQLFVHGKLIGDVPVKIQGTKVVAYESSSLDRNLRVIIKDSVYQRISLGQKWIDADKIPYAINYNTNLLRLTLELPTNELKPIFYSLEDNLHLKYRDSKIGPAPFAGSINYYVDKNYGDEFLGGDNFSVNFNTFFNFNSLVLEMDGFFIKNRTPIKEEYWRRRDFNLTKDFEDQRTRLRVGDTTSRGYSFMRAKYIGGINVKKEFNIDPYTKSYSQGEKEFQILRRSKVKTYINGSLVKDEILPAGNYKLSRLPLVSGLNNIRVEIDDGVGQNEILEFNIPISLSILKKGEFDYSLSHGRKIDDSGKSRKYFDEDFSSGFLQYGFTDNYSLAGYHQSDDKFRITGISNSFSTKYGNFFLGNAYSHNELASNNGIASAVSWELQDIIGNYLKGMSISTRYEYFDNRFQYSVDDNSGFLKHNSILNLSFPLFGKLYVNLGGGASVYRDSMNKDRDFYRASISFNPTYNINLSVYASRSEDSQNQHINSLSAFLTWSFDKRNQYVNIQRDVENDNSRISFTQDNSNKIYVPRYTVSVDNSGNNTRASISSTTPAPIADLYLRAAYARDDDRNYRQYGFGFSTTSLFAYKDGFAFSQARTNNQSFAIFKTSDELSRQPLAIRTTSIYASTLSPAFGDPAIVDLVPYQYREVQVDPSLMDYGSSLEQERFVLHPTYKSGHLIELKQNGVRSISGHLRRNGKPISLEVCQFGDRIFFTDRDGFFFVDGVTEDINLLKVSGKEVEYIDVGKEKKGLINLGIIEIK